MTKNSLKTGPDELGYYGEIVFLNFKSCSQDSKNTFLTIFDLFHSLVFFDEICKEKICEKNSKFAGTL